MTDPVNPYESPESAAVPEKPLASQGNLTENMLIYLKGTSPWLRFIGILGFITAGITALSGIIFLPLFPLMKDLLSEIPDLDSTLDVIFSVVFGGSMAVFCIAGGVVVFFPSLFLYRSGDKIRSYLRTGTDQDLELAFKNNKSFWKFIGILSIIELAFIPLFIIGVIIAAVAVVLA